MVKPVSFVKWHLWKVLQLFDLNISIKGSFFTFRWPCVVINSYNKTNYIHWFLKFIFGIKLYMFRTVPLSIIRSFSLYTQQYVYVIQVSWLLASRIRTELSSVLILVKRGLVTYIDHKEVVKRSSKNETTSYAGIIFMSISVSYLTNIRKCLVLLGWAHRTCLYFCSVSWNEPSEDVAKYRTVLQVHYDTARNLHAK